MVMPSKRFKYTIEHSAGSLELKLDPKGWDGHEIGFQRSEDFGLNIQNVVPLSFSGVGRTLLKSLYEKNSVFAQSRVKIERRQDDWTYAPYYVYKHDYSTYKDNMYFVEMAGIEDGLIQKIDTYKDTEFDIDLPTENKLFLEYTGVSVVKSNQIQCGYGKTELKPGMGTGVYLLRGTRAVRAYNDKIAFTDPSGLPFETMTMRCLVSATVSLKLMLKLSVVVDATIFQTRPDSGVIRVIKHDANFNNPVDVVPYPYVYPFVPDSTSEPANNRRDTFDQSLTFDVALVAGQYLSIFYQADSGKAYQAVLVDDAANCYMEISNLTESAYDGTKLQVFTYEWLIESLLKKIDASAKFVSRIPSGALTEYLSATPCIKNLGNVSGTGTMKVKISDVLESFNKLKCLGINITGNVFTVYPRADLYPKTAADSYGEIRCSKIVVEHDPTHQYNAVKVGSKVDDKKDDGDLVFPFICEKNFKVSDCLSTEELDLVNPFMLDPYQIDQYVIDTVSAASNKDECKFMVFVCPTSAARAEVQVPRTASWTVDQNLTEAGPEGVTVLSASTEFFALQGAQYTIKFRAKALFDSAHGTAGHHLVSVRDDKTNLYTIIEGEGAIPDGEYQVTVPGSGNYKVVATQYFLWTSGTFNVKILLSGATLADTISAYLQNGGDFSFPLYKDQVMTNFQGDPATMYNVPISPKRILQRHKEYLALSTYGKENPLIEYVSSDIVSAITSRCGFETEDVVENSDLDLEGISPIFLPAVITADTDTALVDIDSFENKKYKYLSLRDKKSGKTYEGFINSVTFAISKNREKSITLQAKTI